MLTDQNFQGVSGQLEREFREQISLSRRGRFDHSPTQSLLGQHLATEPPGLECAAPLWIEVSCLPQIKIGTKFFNIY
jgi:hypothetical protein